MAQIDLYDIGSCSGLCIHNDLFASRSSGSGRGFCWLLSYGTQEREARAYGVYGVVVRVTLNPLGIKAW